MKNKVLITICSILLVTDILLSATGFWYSKIRMNVEEGFSLIGDSKVTVLYGKKYNDEGFNVNIINNLNPDVSIENNVDTSKIGKYEVTYTLNYMNYSKSLTREVIVIDNEAPTLAINCEENINLIKDNKFNGCKYEVNDNYDKKEDIKVDIISNLDESKVGDYTVTWKATDTSGNSTEKSIKIHVRNRDDLYYIVVYISKQRLDYYENGKIYLTTPVTTGHYNKTPKGDFKVLKKVRNATLKGADYSSFVKYWIAFKGNSYGIHDASWRNNFGNMNYYYNGSHGCVNTPIDAMSTLYDRVEIGTPVYIKD